ncbi:class I SAM-dependent methyltransferase [Actinomadura parmotrematis]|uniref:Class I SAM-dependent methyltransferase n=1 Tax=Actinomadura parmotrematis TaxID=2864039 RepID=A0ABS7FQF5_9ACTN|nr:class I SAM-dependent methyltransferase [Actinomadura parmotrematis]MBW8482601.1 class I SAM-dependent methyltransferase [Actinomadura parmotrematis]
MEQHHQHEHGHEHGHGHADEHALGEILDLDAEVFGALLADVTARLAKALAAPPDRILDLGSGTGAGALPLLDRFAGAEVVAVDASASLLHRLAAKAREHGAADRVRTIEADLDGTWPDLGGPFDAAWASASLHHMADPDRTLARLHGVLRPGAVLALLEMDGFPRFLPDDIGVGRPGMEARLHEALAAAQAEQVPHLGADWGPRLAAAGFTVEEERTVGVDAAPPATGRYARASLRRLRTHLSDRLDEGDRAALDALLDDDGPHAVLRRDDLAVRSTRFLWLARRPG